MKMYDQFIRVPTEAYQPPEGKQKAIICDIDGTIANCDARREACMKDGKMDWGCFLDPERVSKDKPVEAVVETLNSFICCEVIFLSGREESSKFSGWAVDTRFADDLARGFARAYLPASGVARKQARVRLKSSGRNGPVTSNWLGLASQ